MKTFLVIAGLIAAYALAGWLAAQPPAPPRPLADEMLHTIVSNAVRSCAEEYTKTYVRLYAKALIAEMSNQWAGVRSLTNVVVPLPQSLPQPCEHNWVPLRNYQQEHYCTRCAMREWK